MNQDYNNSNNTGLTPKQHASQVLQAAESVLVVTGQRPTTDQVTAVLAAGLVLRKLGKKVTALISDQIPGNLNFLPLTQLDKDLSGLRDFIMKVNLSKAEVDKLKYTIEDGNLNVHVTPFRGSFSKDDVSYSYGAYHYDVILALGVPARSKLDRIFQQNPGLFEVPIVNIDFHRSNENYGAINLIEPFAGSLSEILLALSESLQTGLLDEPIATVMLTGIIANTDRFTATHTTAKSLTVAAQLMAAGARQQQIVKALYGSHESRVTSHESKPAPTQAKPAVPAVTPTPSASLDSTEGSNEKPVQDDKKEVVTELKNPSVEEILQPAHIEPEPTDEIEQAVANLNALSAELAQTAAPKSEPASPAGGPKASLSPSEA